MSYLQPSLTPELVCPLQTVWPTCNGIYLFPLKTNKTKTFITLGETVKRTCRSTLLRRDCLPNSIGFLTLEKVTSSSGNDVALRIRKLAPVEMWNKSSRGLAPNTRNGEKLVKSTPSDFQIVTVRIKTAGGPSCSSVSCAFFLPSTSPMLLVSSSR